MDLSLRYLCQINVSNLHFILELPHLISQASGLCFSINVEYEMTMTSKTIFLKKKSTDPNTHGDKTNLSCARVKFFWRLKKILLKVTNLMSFDHYPEVKSFMYLLNLHL